MSDELIEGRASRNKPQEAPQPETPPAPEGRKSRLKGGKAQPKAEDEKSGPYVTLVPPDEAGDPMKEQADEPTFHKGMKPVVADASASTDAAPEERDLSAPAPDLPWDVIEAAQPPSAAAPEPEPPEPQPSPKARPIPPAKVSRSESIMKLPRIPDEPPPAPAPEPPAEKPAPKVTPDNIDFVPHFHTPTGELPAVPEDVAPEAPEKQAEPEVTPDNIDFIPHFHTPTGVLPAVPEDVEPQLPVSVPAIDDDIPPIRRPAEDSLTPGILPRVPADASSDADSEPEIPPIRRGRRKRAPEVDDESGKQGRSVALEDDTGGGLPRVRRVVDEVTGEVIDADWVREVGEGEPPAPEPIAREPKRQRGSGIEEAIAERLQARREQAQSRPTVPIKLNGRTILTIISIIALVALAIYVPSRLGLFGGKSGTTPTPTTPMPAGATAVPGSGSSTGGDQTPGGPALAYQQGRLAFASNRDGNYEIYVLDMADGTLTRLTNNSAADRSPSWSPDGKQIAYVSNSKGNDDLWVIPAAGGTPSQLTTDPGSDRNPAWSPDGKLIVSTRENVDGSRLISFPATCVSQPTTCESQLKLLTPGGYDRFPSWAANATKLAFTASDLPGGASVIALLNSDGSGYQSFAGTRTSDLSPSWSPDSSKIAFLSYAEGDYDLWVMYSDGTGVTQITKSQATDGAPGWSPDGRYIVFSSDRDDKQHFNLYLITTDCLASGTNCEDNLIRLTNQAADDLDPAWTR